MRFAVIAAVVGIAAAAPQYGQAPYEPEVPSSAVEYPPVSTAAPVESEYPVTSAPAVEYPPTSVVETALPSETPYPEEEVPEYEVPTEEEKPEEEETPYVPGAPVETPAESTICESSITITVTVPYPSGGPVGTGYPSHPAETPSAPYPTAPAPSAPYPSAPVGTGYPPVAPPVGTASSSGYIKPTPSSYPPEFTGAASSLQLGGFMAGVGAFAAFFL